MLQVISLKQPKMGGKPIASENVVWYCVLREAYFVYRIAWCVKGEGYFVVGKEIGLTGGGFCGLIFLWPGFGIFRPPPPRGQAVFVTVFVF